MTVGIERARGELEAARLLAAGGYPAQAVATAFRTGLRAAEDALLLLDRIPAAPDDVVTSFVRYVVRERGLDPGAGWRLRGLANRRALTDQATAPVPAAEATAAIDDAAAVVEVVGRWIDESIRAAEQRAALRTGRPPPRPVRRRH